MKKTSVANIAVVVLILLVSAVHAEANAKVVPIDGIKYNVNASMADNLTPLVGRQVCVTLASGTVFVGTVKAVGQHLLHLAKLSSKDFFDALIRLDDIVAIDVRFRDFRK